jgi:cysteine desulfurase / selenocysteine lyase
MLDLGIKADFPIFNQQIKGHDLVYLDNAATTQCPGVVIKAMSNYYMHDHSNIHRGIYTLSERASALYQEVRVKVSSFLGANSEDEIIFTSGTTSSINMIASAYVRNNLIAEDEIIISAMEHHSNFIPWQMLAKEMGLVLKIVPVLANGTLDYEAYCGMLSTRTKFIALTHVSNVLGTVNPIKDMIKKAKKYNVPVLIDGAQAASHLQVDVQDLGCDFYVFSAHKIYGPTGVGVLYAKAECLAKMDGYQYGGGTVLDVSFDEVKFLSAPNKFEAGTPNIVGVIGLGAAIDYFMNIGWHNILENEHQLLAYLLAQLKNVKGIKLFGTSDIGVVSFALDEVHPHDIASLLNDKGVAVRAGTHCAMPLLKSLGLGAVTRASLGIYSTKSDVDILCNALRYTCEVFAV